MNSTRNVIAIDRVPVSSLLGYKRIGINSAKCDVATPWQPLLIKVPARLTISDKIEGGVRIYTAQAVFKLLCDDDPATWARQAFRCRTADGQSILIGTVERPYPIVNTNNPRPDNMTDSQLIEVTVNYTSDKPIPFIL